MLDQRRFGKKLPLPSTAQIIHELKMMILEDRIKELQKEIAWTGTPVDTPKQDGGDASRSTKSR